MIRIIALVGLLCLACAWRPQVTVKIPPETAAAAVQAGVREFMNPRVDTVYVDTCGKIP